MKRELSLLCAGAVWACVMASSAHAEEKRAYVRAIPDAETWKDYSRELGADRFGKFIIDVNSGDIYFIDVNLFEIHADFVLDVLLDEPWTADNIREYNRNYERDKPLFILGYVTHHLKTDQWTFGFWSGDDIGPADILRTRKKLDETFFVKKLPFRPSSPRQEEVAHLVARRVIDVITNDEIYKAADYQSFNEGEAVGTLRVVPKGTPFDELVFERNDIVLLQRVYPDIPPVSGIITTVFSTPLSHVNLRARAWGIPKAGYTRALEEYASLDGEMVYLEVTDTGHTLRPATDEEIQHHREALEDRRTVEPPPVDLDDADLAMLTEIRASEVDAYGAKTANLEGDKVWIVQARPYVSEMPVITD